MARFWILFLIVWYKACTIVHTEDVQQSNNQITSQTENLDDQKTRDEKENTYYMENPAFYIKARTAIDDIMRHIMPTPRESYELKNQNLIYELPNGMELRNSLLDDSINEKRGFRAWGGKRDVYKEKKEEIVLPEFSKTFYAWRGRRSMYPDNTPKLYSLPELSEANFMTQRNNKIPLFSDNWGGKRNYDDSDSSPNSIKEYVDSNSPFLNTNTVGLRRHRFSSWGGKRADDNLEDYTLKKNFNAWGGK